MTLSEIANLRLVNQQIANPVFTHPKKLVSWMGALQAQDFNMVKWAVGLRCKNSDLSIVEEVFNKGDILRTHLMRPTWHLVSSDDIYWMLELTAPRIINAMKFRDRELGLTEEVFKKSNLIIEKTFSKVKNISREELAARFAKEGLKTDENRLSHLLYHAELSGIICSGVILNGKQTYALLSDRVPTKKSIQKDEALAELASRYFTSHGPATLKDFTWWSGLSVTEAREALESVKSKLTSQKLDQENYFFVSENTTTDISKSLFLLPSYDEFLISYKDRSASLTRSHLNKTVSNNGMFYPVIIENGVVTGLWKRSFKKETVVVESKFFDVPDLKTKDLLKKKATEYGNFHYKYVEVLI